MQLRHQAANLHLVAKKIHPALLPVLTRCRHRVEREMSMRRHRVERLYQAVLLEG